MAKGLKTALKITGIVLGIIVALILLLYAFLWVIRGIKYKESSELREYACMIPALGDGFVPQGITYSEESELYITTGYNASSDLTELFIVKNDEPTRVNINGLDGKPLKGHGGGVTVAKDYVYIANDAKLTYYSLDALMTAAGAAVDPLGAVDVHNNASFCFSMGSELYVGEFYREQNYKTDETHHLTTPSGETNHALVTMYALDGSGFIDPAPLKAISVPDLVQGFAATEDYYIISRSYGLTDSKLEYYERKPDLTDTIRLKCMNDGSSDAEAPLAAYLDSTTHKKTITLPSFSEDLAIVDGRVAVTNEAACNKYIIGKLFGATKVWTYPTKF